MLQVVASLTIAILTIIEVSFTLLEKYYSTGITRDDRHLQSSYFYSTGLGVKPDRVESPAVPVKLDLDAMTEG